MSSSRRRANASSPVDASPTTRRPRFSSLIVKNRSNRMSSSSSTTINVLPLPMRRRSSRPCSTVGISRRSSLRCPSGRPTWRPGCEWPNSSAAASPPPAGPPSNAPWTAVASARSPPTSSSASHEASYSPSGSSSRPPASGTATSSTHPKPGPPGSNPSSCSTSSSAPPRASPSGSSTYSPGHPRRRGFASTRTGRWNLGREQLDVHPRLAGLAAMRAQLLLREQFGDLDRARDVLNRLTATLDLLDESAPDDTEQ